MCRVPLPFAGEIKAVDVLSRLFTRVAACFAILLLATPCLAASKLPSSADGYRNSAVYNGHQNMPFTNYGVGIKWELDCRKGDTAMCVKLADAYAGGLGDITADMRVALGFYTMACTQGDGASCAKAASIVVNGSANFSDSGVAKGLADRGCNQLKNQDACAVLAQVAGSTGDTAQAAALADSSCAKGADEGCRQKAEALYSNATTAAQALPMLQTACANKRAWGCADLADAYYRGYAGVSKDIATAKGYARTGCEQGDGNGRLLACRYHGMFLTYVGNDKATLNKGEKYLNTVCLAGDGPACTYIGRIGQSQISGATTTLTESGFYLRHGCDLGDGEGCSYLGTSYLIGIDPIHADPAIALALSDKGCKLGNAEACAQASDIAAKNPGVRSQIPAIDPSATAYAQLAMAKKAVDSGDRVAGVLAVIRLMQEDDENAEWMLGGWMYYGLDGVFAEGERKNDGVILIENAARVGHVDADIWMGMAYWYGEGVQVDQQKAMNYMSIAADRGNAEAKAILRSMQAEPIRQENARRAAEAEAAAKRQKSGWEMAMDAWDAALRSGAFAQSYVPNYSSTTSGQSVSDPVDKLNWNYALSYYSGGTSVCLSSNPYC
jgi:TPR repeat protein